MSTNCPVCAKELDGSLDSITQHVNMCIDENENLQFISKFKDFYDTGSLPTFNVKSNPKPAPSRRRTGSKKDKTNTNYIIASSNGRKFCLSRPPSRPLTDLTKLTLEEKQERIRTRMHHILKTNIIADNCTYGSQPSLPYLWTLSSLNDNDVEYVVNGFEKFCKKLD